MDIHQEAADCLQMMQREATNYTSDDGKEMVILPKAVYADACAWMKLQSLPDEPKGQNV